MKYARARKTGHRADSLLLALVLVLTVAGLVILSSASSELGKIKFNDSYYYLKHQLLTGLVVGIAGFAAAYVIAYYRYRSVAFLLLLINLGLLVLVFTNFGVRAGGAARWVEIGPVIFQPSELLKLSFIIYLAAWLTNSSLRRVDNFWSGVIPFFIILALVGGILVLQPATSTVVILLGAGMVMYFVSGARYTHIGLTALIGLIALGALIWSSPYRWARIQAYLNPGTDAEGSSYQLTQALDAIGSGGLWGIGYGKSTAEISRLPAPLGDSIFAIAAQELGFVGAGVLVTLFALLVFRLLWIAHRMHDSFGKLILIGFACIIGFQSIVHIGAISGLLPLTGVPLPFVSYGGTALAVFLTMSGIAANISKYT